VIEPAETVSNKTFLVPDSKSIDHVKVSTIRRSFRKQSLRSNHQACDLASVDLSTVLYTSWSVLLHRYMRTEVITYAAFLPDEDKFIGFLAFIGCAG